MDQNSSGPTSEREDMVEEFCESIAAKHIKLMREFFQIDQIAEILPSTDPERVAAVQEFFTKSNKSGQFLGNAFRFNREDLLGDFDLEIRKGSTLPLNKQTQQQVIQGLISSVGAQLPPAVLNAMIREFVASFEMKTIEKAFDDAEKQERVTRVVEEALARDRQTVRDRSQSARSLGLAAGDGGSEVPPIP